METLSNIIIWAGLISIIYWVFKKYEAKKNGQKYEKHYKPIIIGIAFLIVGSIVSPVNTSTETVKTDVKKSSIFSTKKSSSIKSENKIKKANNTSTTSKSSTINYNFDNVKPDMSKDQVINAIGAQPTDKDEYTLYYGDEDLDFNEDRLIGSSVQSIQDKVDAKYKAAQNSEKKQSEQRDSLKYQAQYFGQKDVETLQKMSSTYKSTRIDNGMMYTFHFNKDMLIRIDTDDGYTTVYKYDNNANDGLGEQLYNGKTIIQKENQPYYFFN